MRAYSPYFASAQAGTMGTVPSNYGASRTAPRASAGVSIIFLAGMLLVHIAGGLAMRELPVLATVHALLTVVVSLAVVIRGTRVADAICAVAYIAGSEVLWRMTQATVPWEYAKYAVALVAFAGLARRGFKGTAFLPVLYFLLLVPSCLITLETLAWNDARRQISLYLAGPLALVACLLLFGSFRAHPEIVKKCLLFYLAPAAAVAALAFFGIQAAGEVEFGSASNFAASGGFGPVQVSSALGLGSVIAFHFACDKGWSWIVRSLFLGLTLWFLGQSLLTFSRTGLYSAGLAIAGALPFLLQSGRVRWSAMAAFGGLMVIGAVLVFPNLNDFTGGRLKERFADSRTTGRDQLMFDDLKVWREHPFLGVGPGVGKWLREKSGSAAHTEYSRLLSEHGLCGLTAMAVLVLILFRQFRKGASFSHRALIASMLIWAMVFMASDAMRLVAAALALSVGSIRLVGWRRETLDSTRVVGALPGEGERGGRVPSLAGLWFREVQAEGGSQFSASV
jgi:hypothetical protein